LRINVIYPSFAICIKNVIFLYMSRGIYIEYDVLYTHVPGMMHLRVNAYILLSIPIGAQNALARTATEPQRHRDTDG